MAWLHNTCAKIKSWFDNLESKNLFAFWVFKIVGWLFLTVAAILVGDFWPHLQWGWIMTVCRWLIGVLILSVFLILDYRKGKLNGLQLFWRPWLLILAFSILFLIIRFQQASEINSFNLTLASTNSHFSEKIATLNYQSSSDHDFYSGITNKLHDGIVALSQQATDAKNAEQGMRQERDHYHDLLVPFEAFAMAKYTNESVEQSLPLLIASMTATITNALNGISSEKTTICLMLNKTYPINVDNTEGAIVTNTPFAIVITNAIDFRIKCLSKTTTAINPTIDFISFVDQTNISSDGWALEPRSDDGRNCWQITYNGSIAYPNSFQAKPITILPNFKGRSLPVEILIYADNSIPLEYSVVFVFTD